LIKGLFPNAFCKILPDFISNDSDKALIMHADGAGTKSAFSIIFLWKKTGDISVWKGIAQDALIMNLERFTLLLVFYRTFFSSSPLAEISI
jgi:phosphoribosylformylglycinamidine cyclo-ligase